MNITFILIGATVLVSLLAFNNPQISNSLLFWPYRMWRNKEWYRLVSCSFVHGDMGHLFFNMFALYSFGNYMESSFNYIFESNGPIFYLVLYFGAVATADLLNLFTQKDNYNYRSLGASGGVSAIIFSFILLNPFGKISLFFIPIGIPAVIFGLLYLVYCVYMAKRGTDNIGHIAHFTGSIFGFIFPILFQPQLIGNFIEQIANALS